MAVVACEASLSRAPASWRAASAGVLDWEGLRQRGDKEGAACAHRASLHVLERVPRGRSPTFFFEISAGPLAS